MSIYKKLLTFILIFSPIISGCSSDKMPKSVEGLNKEISKYRKKIKKLDEIRDFDKIANLKEKISEYQKARIPIMWDKAQYEGIFKPVLGKKRPVKFYVTKKQKSLYRVWEDKKTGSKSSVYMGKLNKKIIEDDKRYTKEITYKLQKGKICKYDKLTASTDWNSGSDYYMIKRPVRQKMRRICY